MVAMVCLQNAGEPHLQGVPNNLEDSGFQTLETIPSVLPWLAALNKKGGGLSESTRLTGDADRLACVVGVQTDSVVPHSVMDMLKRQDIFSSDHLYGRDWHRAR